MSFLLTIATPDKTYYEGSAEGMVCPGTGGYFGVLTGHAPMVAVVGVGIVKVETDQAETLFFVVDGGVADVSQERVNLLVDHVIAADNEVQAEGRLAELTQARSTPESSP